MSIQVRFGRLLAAHRVRHGWRQADLAQAADLSIDMIAKIESGSTGTSFAAIERLANALEVDPAALFSHSIPGGPPRRGLADLVAQLSALTDAEVSWVAEIVRAALKPRS